MTVAELQKLLRKLPANAQVYLDGPDDELVEARIYGIPNSDLEPPFLVIERRRSPDE